MTMSRTRKQSEAQQVAELVQSAKEIQDPCVRCCIGKCTWLCQAKQAYNGLQSSLVPFYPKNSEEVWE